MRRQLSTKLFLGASALGLLAAPAHADSLEGLGDLPGGGTVSQALFGISDDGSVVVGSSGSGSGIEAFRWTQGGGIVGLGDLAGGGFYSEAWDVSGDGLVVVGSSLSDSGDEAFRWTQGGGMVGLGDLAGGGFNSTAFAVSGDGAVVVGRSSSASGTEAFRWTQGSGMVGLGDLAGGSFYSQAFAVSADGAVVVGGSDSASGSEAFRWTQGGGMVGLGDLAGGPFLSEAYAVSADGAVVVGRGYSASGGEAFRWTQGGGMIGLGHLSGGDSVAFGVSADGAVIVGTSDSVSGIAAFAWTEADGMRAVADVLTENGVDLTGWNLQIAWSVSSDGSVVAGVGVHDGFVEGWIAHIDLGLVSIEDQLLSISRVIGVNQSAQQTGAAHLESLLDLASHYGPAIAPGAWSAWGGVSLQHYDVLKIDPEAVAGQLGLAFQASPAWRIGFGVQWGSREDDLNVFDSESDSERIGAGAFVSYEPGDSGLRLRAAIAGDRIENDIQRGYMNGGDPVSSRGSQDGAAYGAAVQAGWAFAIGANTRLTPFASYEASRIDLDGYTETGGPFPATFDAVEETLQIARVGGEAEHRFSDNVRAWGSLVYAHRFSDTLPGVTGSVEALSSPFSIEGASVDENWGEAAAGLEWRALQAMRIQAAVNVASSGDTDANWGGRLTAMFDF